MENGFSMTNVIRGLSVDRPFCMHDNGCFIYLNEHNVEMLLVVCNEKYGRLMEMALNVVRLCVQLCDYKKSKILGLNTQSDHKYKRFVIDVSYCLKPCKKINTFTW